MDSGAVLSVAGPTGSRLHAPFSYTVGLTLRGLPVLGPRGAQQRRAS